MNNNKYVKPDVHAFKSYASFYVNKCIIRITSRIHLICIALCSFAHGSYKVQLSKVAKTFSVFAAIVSFFGLLACLK